MEHMIHNAAVVVDKYQHEFLNWRYHEHALYWNHLAELQQNYTNAPIS
jgi:hypothetical protein